MDSSRTVLKNAEVYTENDKIADGYVVIEEGKIMETGPMDRCPTSNNSNTIVLNKGDRIIPGFIDLHIHGANGADVMDATEDALETMAQILPQEGTTSFLATSMTGKREDIEASLRNVTRYMHDRNEDGKAEVLGVHLEGPFLSPARAGAQHPENIIEPDLELFQDWQEIAGGNIRLVTLAPERPGGLELTEHLKETGVVASIGHSDAVYEEVIDAIAAGVSHATHLFNGMRGLHHREPGVLGGVLLHDEIKSEIIADGIHVRPEMVKLAYRNKGKAGMILITDAMRAKCLGKGNYDLGGQDVTVTEDRATLHDGTLAGSILKLKDAARNMMSFTGCDLRDVIEMASVNPAKQIGLFDRKGSIAAGKDADLIVLNDTFDVKLTLCRGQIAYEKKG